MLNLTLTITAAPELLAAMTSFTSAITSAKVAEVPEYTLDFTERKASKENVMQVPVQKIQTPIQTTVQTVPTPIQVPLQTVPTQGTSVPTSAQSYTMEQLAVAATQIVDAGHQAELVSLLSSFGVQALTTLPKEQYCAFATALRNLGAKI